tara:strand:- start:829 stop:2178 length:1350 start_codon:yes stop_codon:yes gene_type:complete
MAYSGVKEPRFYIDEIQHLQSTGFDFNKYYEDNYYDNYQDNSIFGSGQYLYKYNTFFDIPNIFQLNPNIQKDFNFPFRNEEDTFSIRRHYIDIPAVISNIEGDNIGRYIGILNHNLKYERLYNGLSESIYENLDMNIYDGYRIQWLSKNNETLEESDRQGESCLNFDKTFSLTHTGGIPKDGSTIITFDPSSENFNPPNNKSFYRLNLYKKVSPASGSNVVGQFVNTWDGFGLGALSYGIYYDLRTPDLDIEMTTEFDGFSSTKTLGGSTLTSVRYSGSPWWYDVSGTKKREPFQIYEPEGQEYYNDQWHIVEEEVGKNEPKTKRNGRRVWSLKFSYLSDTDIFASNSMSNNYYEHSSSDSTDDTYNDAGDLDDSVDAKDFRYTLEESNSFMAQVINRIGNGQRFIFQPDKNNNNPDQFAICMLDMDEFSVKQVAYRTYSFDLKIREVW